MPRTVQPGQLLDGRYRLIDTIGHGGMSTVWRARDERLGRIAAVKILAAGLLLDSASRLRTEAQALARLHHPHIAEVYDYGTGDVPYLVMELVDGVPLSRALAGGASLPWAQAASVAAQTASALAAAHQRGMVHRDVASGNILLTAAGVKLIDFGISASEGNIEADRGETLVGTPAYLAPERIAGHPVQPESDVYALGVVLYRMLSGHFPFEAEDAGKLIRAHRDLPPPPLPAVSGMPAIVADLCRSCLAKDPASRPAAADLAHSLFDLLGSAITVPVPIGAAADDFLPTHLLPWPDGTKPPQAAAAPSRSGPFRSGRAKATLAAAGLLLAVASAWTANDWDTPTAAPAAADPLATQQSAGAAVPCAVTYQSTRDDGGSFAATITVVNLGDRTIGEPRLSFDLPGDQRLLPGPIWRQDGRSVTTASALPALPAGTGERIPLAGTYSGPHAYPLAYLLNGSPCAVSVFGPGGEPVIVASSSSVPRKPVVIVDISPTTGGYAPTPGTAPPPGTSPSPWPQPTPSPSEPDGSSPSTAPSPPQPTTPSHTPKSGRATPSPTAGQHR